MNQKVISPRRFYLFAVCLFFFLTFLLLAMRDGDTGLVILSGAVPAAVVLSSLLPVRIFSLDKLLTSLALTLCAFGILAVASVNPEDAVPHALRYVAAMAFLLPPALLIPRIQPSVSTAAVSGFLSLALLTVPLLMPASDFSWGESAAALMITGCAALLVSQKHLAALLLALTGMALMLLACHPMAAIILGAVLLLMMWSASARPAVLALSLSAMGLLFYAAWLLNPSLFALADTSVIAFRPPLFGPDSAAVIPEDRSSVLPLLASRYGLVLAGSAVLLFPIMMLRGVSVARASRSRFCGLLAIAAVLLISLYAIAAMLYDFGIWPLEKVAMPFLSSELPSLGGSFLLTGMLGGVASVHQQELAEDARISALAQ